MAEIVVSESLTLDGVMQAPGRPDEDPRGGFAHGGWGTAYLNKVQKYVVSATLTEPLPWVNSTLLRPGDDLPAAVAALRDRTDGDVAVLGSGQLVRALAAAGLVDRYVLLIHPLILGTGIRLFEMRTRP